MNNTKILTNLSSRFTITVLTLFLTVSFGCKHANVTTDEKYYSYTDDYNRTVMVPSSPQRVVSMSPAVTEIIFALGADDLLVGRTEFCTYPPEAAKIENVGGISNLNIEKVLSCNPDLIICGSMVPQKVVEQFAKMGVPMVCVIEKNDFTELYSNIMSIGSLVGKEKEADSLVKALVNRMDTMGLDFEGSDENKPTCYYVVGFGTGGNFTAGGNTFINDIIRMAGGRNIAADSEGWAFSLEALMDADPDYILIRAEDSARFCQTSPYKRLSAVKKGNIISLHDGMLDLQVPRNIDAISLIHQHISK